MGRYTLQWRRLTPKGTPMEVKTERNLTMAELARRVDEVCPQAMWVYVEDQDRMRPEADRIPLP